jgi:hypothetical protein
MMLFAIPAFLGIELPEAEVGRCSWATIIIYLYLKFKKIYLASKKYGNLSRFSSYYLRRMFFFQVSGCDKFVDF